MDISFSDNWFKLKIGQKFIKQSGWLCKSLRIGSDWWGRQPGVGTFPEMRGHLYFRFRNLYTKIYSSTSYSQLVYFFARCIWHLFSGCILLQFRHQPGNRLIGQ